MLALIYSINIWLMQSSSNTGGETFLDKIIGFPFNWHGLGLTLREAILVLIESPASFVLSFLIVGGFVAFAEKGGRIFGLSHGLAHLIASVMLAWVFAVINFALFGGVAVQTVEAGWRTLVFAAGMLAGGSFVAGSIFGVYLTICALMPPRFLHINEAFSVQGIPDFKNFLRIKIDATGRLTVFPIGVRKIRRWSLRDKKTERPRNHEPWFKSEDKAPLDRLVHLIESPLEFASPRDPDSSFTQGIASSRVGVNDVSR